MIPANPFAISDNDQFIVGDSDLAFFDSYAGRIEGCVILFCREGSADVIISQIQRTLKTNSLALLLPGSILLLANRSENFRVSFCSFSHDLFAEAAFRIEPSFFHSLRERPVTMASQHIAQGASIWFDMAVYTYSDRENMFRNTIIKNRLQNLLLETYDKMLRFAFPEQEASSTTTRQTELFQRFVSLLHEHCAHEREVSFYADKLCISTRYLSNIIQLIAHTSAKHFIDRSVVLEIKMMLQSTDLSVQEIAYKLKFPDQSYLGRFFKKHTGMSPSEYRKNKK
ncbi:MAG TPA: helix-turn-helix domain-containing protein [Candidatus Alistipes faecavium]|uniref:AraC family transcriptional regulator n=1 Tax=uncultured Alistipes sp. TaxID=538949 RepID=UPI001F922FC9|nr:helix-turn-helix domain-containing protein [uncultured Alistipes sp.]HJA96501.1 helix-turn-helix domain-containing protein [Candidatus Alistipes faecavium]